MNHDTIRAAAIRLAKEHGLINLTRAALAEAVGIPDGSFLHVAGISFTALMEELQADVELMATQPAVQQSPARTSPALRYTHILGVAVEKARTIGWNNLTRSMIAEAAGVSEALVSHYFGTMEELKQTVMNAAVQRRVIEIVAQGLAAGNPAARSAPEEVKAQALAWMA